LSDGEGIKQQVASLVKLMIRECRFPKL